MDVRLPFLKLRGVLFWLYSRSASNVKQTKTGRPMQIFTDQLHIVITEDLGAFRMFFCLLSRGKTPRLPWLTSPSGNAH